METSSRQAPARVVADRVHYAAIHLLRRLRVEDKAMGLTAPRASVLSVLVFRGPVTMSALAEAEQVAAEGTRASRRATRAGRRELVSGRSARAGSRRRLDGTGPFGDF